MVELIEVGDPLIVRMGQTKVGLSRQLAAAVLVTEAALMPEATAFVSETPQLVGQAVSISQP